MAQMGIIKFFLLFLAIFNIAHAAAITGDHGPGDIIPAIVPSLEEFVKLVDKHNLNISIIRSHKDDYSNGNVKKDVGLTIKFPANDVVLHEATLNADEIKALGDKTKELNKHVRSGAEFRKVIVKHDGTDNEVEKVETHKEATIESLNYDGLIRNINIRKLPAYSVLDNFVVTDAEGGNKLIKVLSTHIRVEVLQKGDGVSDADVEKIKSVVLQQFLIYNTDELYAKAVAKTLDSELQDDFQVIVGAPEKYHLPTVYQLLLKIGDQNILIYKLKK